MRLSIKHKLFLSILLLIVSFTACSLLFINLYFKSLLKMHFIHMGKDLAGTASSHVTDSVLIEDVVVIQNYFESIMQNNPDVAYIFIEKGGSVLLHTFSNGFPKNLIDVGHAKNAIEHIQVQTEDALYHDFSAPIFKGSAGTLRLGMQSKSVDSLLDTTVKALFAGSFVAILVALLFSIAIANKLAAPLGLLTDSAAMVAKGDYTKPIAAGNDSEVGKLASAFNDMIDAIRVREQELRDTNEQLETYGARMHQYINELAKTKDQLIKSKQDTAVVETAQAFLHHLRQPLTFLFIAIDTLLIEIKQGNLHEESATKKLHAVEVAATRLAELLKKFENLREYKTVEFSGNIKILDIDKTGKEQ